MPAEFTVLEKKEHPSFSASLRSDGIVHFTMKDIDDYTIEIVDAQTEILLEFGKGKKMPTIITITSYNVPNDRTMKYTAEEKNVKYSKSIAVVVDSLALRLGANFYLNFFKPKIPTKLFNSNEKAARWLKR